MKKKLSLSDLKVSSFVTETKEDNAIKGGSVVTEYSCYKNISCFEFQCALHTQPNYCQITGHVTGPTTTTP